MTEPIFNTVSGIFGMRGTGKTLYLKGSEEFNLPGFFQSYIDKKMKVLIIDTIDHNSYRDIPVIQLEQLKIWKQGVYRIWQRPDDMPEFTNYLNTLDSIYNSLIVYEDAYKHQARELDKPVKNLIIDSKQKNIDIIFMYHSWGMAPQDLFRMIDLIEVFKTKDHPKCRKDNMPGYYDTAVEVYNDVMANKSRFYHKLINTDL